MFNAGFLIASHRKISFDPSRIRACIAVDARHFTQPTQAWAARARGAASGLVRPSPVRLPGFIRRPPLEWADARGCLIVRNDSRTRLVIRFHETHTSFPIMNSLIVLNEADQLRLHSIIHRSATAPHPNHDQTSLLHEILSAARTSPAEPDFLTYVGFGDITTLVSPVDSQDFYRFRIVMPHESDVDQDHISIFMPIATAVIGRPVGQRVSWTTPSGVREMRIISVRKSVP